MEPTGGFIPSGKMYSSKLEEVQKEKKFLRVSGPSLHRLEVETEYLVLPLGRGSEYCYKKRFGSLVLEEVCC